jgi:hypothetical protein
MKFNNYGFNPKKGLSNADKLFIEETVKPAIEKGLLILTVQGGELFIPKTIEEYNEYNRIHRGMNENVILMLKKDK